MKYEERLGKLKSEQDSFVKLGEHPSGMIFTGEQLYEFPLQSAHHEVQSGDDGGGGRGNSAERGGGGLACAGRPAGASLLT